MQPSNKVTYISLSADDPAIDAGFAAAIEVVRAELGRSWPLRLAGRVRPGGPAPIDSRSPIDARITVAKVAAATETDVRDAVTAAHTAFPAWCATPWPERCAIIERAAELVRERKFELAVWLIWEMGKNRV